MSERLKFLGRLREKEREAKELELRLRGDIRVLRDILDPHEDLADVEFSQAAAQAVEAADKHIRHKRVLGEIKILKRDLGEE